MSSNTQQAWGRRVFLSLAGAMGAMAVSVSLVSVHQTLSEDIPFLVGIGLLAPLALMVACMSLLWVTLCHCPHSPQAEGTSAWSGQSRWRLLLGGPSLVVAWFLLAQVAVRLLAALSSRPVVGGLLLAMAALGILSLFARAVDGISYKLAKQAGSPSLTSSLGLGLGVPVLVVPVLVIVGSSSGVGSYWAIFGVFKRPELDLLPVAHLLLLFAGAYCGAQFFDRWRPRIVLLGFVFAVMLLMAGSLSAAMAGFRTTVQVERARGLESLGLRLWRKTNDFDGDGFSRWFGGEDCDDDRSDVFPGAQETPDNGIDEDCSGGDAKASRPDEALAKEVTEPPDAPAQERAALPVDANFLLLTIDTLRADLGYTRMGGAKSISPHLDALAKKSTVYERAYSLASYTSKSLPPMLLGRYASESPRSFEHFDRFAPAVPFVQEILKGAGVKTVSVQGYWYFFFKGYGLERGWDIIDSEAAPKVVKVEGDRSSNGERLADRAIAQLSDLSKSGERFFLWTHWVDPHAEYVPHEAFDYGKGERERYNGEVSFVDAQVGRVLEALERLSLAKKTVVMVTSDHGEAFGEHGMIRHGFEVWEELVHVPLLVHVPGVPPRTVSERRSLIDTVPTILETFGVDAPEGADSFLRGSSLYEELLSDPQTKVSVRPVLVDMPKGPHNQERRAFYQGDKKLIVSRGRVLGLYDLSSDPEEKKDLSTDQAEVRKMQEAMAGYTDGLRPVAATRR